jgi:hypothetical protein
MHFIKTIAAAFALTATASAFPLQKRQDDAAVGNPASTFLLSTHLSISSTITSSSSPPTSPIPSSSVNITGEKSQTDTNIPDVLDDLLTNVQGGLRGGLDFLSIPSGDSETKKAKREEDIPGAAGKFSSSIAVERKGFADMKAQILWLIWRRMLREVLRGSWILLVRVMSRRVDTR